MKNLILYCVVLSVVVCEGLVAADRIKDFRSTNQSLALVSLAAEFVDPGLEIRLTQDLRRKFNRYIKTFDEASVGQFKLGTNPLKQFFKPIVEALSEQQKKFLQNVGKENSADIIVLGFVRQNGDATDIELQLYDVRIEAFSKIEKTSIRQASDRTLLDDLVYRVMNYLDREGYVYNTPQDFLEPPVVAGVLAPKIPTLGGEEFSINPADLGSGALAGEVVAGGDKVPFWEKWWFWTILGGGLLTAGGLTYYFLVVNQPPTATNVHMTLP